MTIVAIHQPNFFPWLGYFDKIARSDVFIFLDHVQLQKTGGTWSNRVKLLQGGEARWVTAPILRKFHGVLAIRDMEFRLDDIWREKFIKSLIANYARTPHFRAVLNFLEPLILNPERNIARYNGTVIKSIAQHLGFTGDKFRWSSDVRGEGQASEMLVSLTRIVGGDAYMCGGGATGYQEDAAFSAAGIGLIYQNFEHPVYPQIGAKEFAPGLSIIDALMNIGVVELRAALKAAADLTKDL